MGWHSGAVISTVALRQEDSGFELADRRGPILYVWSLQAFTIPVWATSKV